MGAGLGLLGANISSIGQIWTSLVAGVVAVLLGAANILGRLLQPWELHNAETPKSWIELRPISWAILNGGALGLGFVTRVGFWAWYSLPLLEVRSASWQWGAVIGTSYGLGRTLLGPLWQTSQLRRQSSHELVQRITASRQSTFRIQGGLMLATGTALLIAAI